MKGIVFIFVLTRALLAAPDAAPPTTVTATRLDGARVIGNLIDWTDGEVVIKTPDGVQRIDTEGLISLRWPNTQATLPQELAKSGHVELADGTVLPASDYRVSGNKATVSLDAPLPTDDNLLTLPVREVSAVKLQSFEPEAAVQWKEIRAQDLVSDVIVVLKRDGKSLDYVEVVLGDVTPEKIEFKLNDESMRVDRANVAGLIYYRPNRKADAKPQSVLHGRTGLKANAAIALASDGVLHITTVSGISLDWPASDIHLADFTAGKILYLSDIEPASQLWIPLVGLPPDSELAANFGKMRRDQSAYGGPLSLRASESDAVGTTAQSRSFEKGLAIRSRTELVYRLPAGFRRFVALAGIEPVTSTTGNVKLIVRADDRSVFESNIKSDQPPTEIDLDVAGVKRLKITVDFGENLDTGDWLNLCEARLIK